MTLDEEVSLIETTIRSTLDVAQRKDARDTAQSRLTVYEKALRAVRDLAGTEAMRDLGTWIRAEIRDDAVPPSGRAVRQRGAAICRAHGEAVSTGSWLGA